MKDFFLHIYDWMSARKRLAAALLLVLLGLSLWSALRLEFQEDINAFLPEQPQVKGQEQMAVLFQGGDIDATLDGMYAFEDHWNAAHPDLPISAQAGQDAAMEAIEFLSANWPYFLQEADYARMDSLLAVPGYVQEALQRDKESLYTAQSLQVRYLRTDPLGLYLPVLQRLNGAQPATRMEDGCLFTADGSTGILLFDSPYGGSESARNAEFTAWVNAGKQAVAQEHPEVRILSTGGPEVAAENASRIKKDSLLALLVAALLICIVLWFSYKRIADVLWILLSIGAGALFALGILACFKSSISLIVLGIGCTIIGIAVNYPLHYVDHLKYQPDKRQALAQQVNPLLVGNITTVGAFLGLLLMKADALRDFGFVGALMLVGTILFVLLFLPLFIPLAKRPRKALKLDFDRHIHAGPVARKAFFGAFLVLTLAFFFLGRRVGFDANLHNINYMTPEQEEGFAILESMKPQPVSGLDLSEQEAAIARWNAFWAQHQEVPALLSQEAQAQGFTPQSFQPFTEALEKTWEPQEAAYFAPVNFGAQEQNFAASLVADLSEDLDTIGLVCSLIVFFFLWLSFGSLELGLVCFLPLAVSWIWIQGIMGLTGLQFNIVNIILATFIFGQGDDYSIFITEGLLYERATGKKILHSFKNAVVLSALIMFIGIGALVLARHPAMRSLGLVTVIGMLTVVAMAYYLPPLLLRWLTTKKGEPRKTPLTIGGLLGTAYLMLQMAFWMMVMSLLALVVSRGAYHRIIRRFCSWGLRIIPGCRFRLYNPHGEDFSKQAVYVCNHQSHMDVLALLALQPKMIFMTNEWAWQFPFYRALLRKADFFPSSWGFSRNGEHLKKLVAEGYSIAIFPEGTRSTDGQVGRFHRGAFLLAREMGLDVLPLCLHGFTYALPKHDFYLRKAGLSLEVGERVQVPAEADLAAFTRNMRRQYIDWYAAIRQTRETAAYCAPYVRDCYRYRGHDAQAECRSVLRKEVYARIDALEGPSVVIENAGCGVEALLTALAHPNMQVTAHIADEEQFLTATRCLIPSNLHYVHG